MRAAFARIASQRLLCDGSYSRRKDPSAEFQIPQFGFGSLRLIKIGTGSQRPITFPVPIRLTLDIHKVQPCQLALQHHFFMVSIGA